MYSLFLFCFLRGFGKQCWNAGLRCVGGNEKIQTLFSRWFIQQQNGCHRTGMSRVFGQLQLNSLMLEKMPKITSKEIL